MHKITLKRPRATVIHPNDSDLRFEVERPTPAEVAEYSDSLQQFTRYEVALHPITKEVLRKANGEPEFIRRDPIYPKSVITDFLRRYVKNIHGLMDEDGRAINFDNEKDRCLDALLSPDLMVTVERDGKIIPVLLPQWLSQEMMNPETYHPLGPRATPSSEPLSADTETPAKSAMPA